jgi:hypothetical protein
MTGAASLSRDLQPVTEKSALLSLCGGRSTRARETSQGSLHRAEASRARARKERRQPQERQHSAATWRDAGPTAVARPVNKAPERGTVIATPACHDGGARERVPPASDTLFFREGSKPSGRDAARLGLREPGAALPHAHQALLNSWQRRRTFFPLAERPRLQADVGDFAAPVAS